MSFIAAFFASTIGRALMVAAGLAVLGGLGKCAWDAHLEGVRDGERQRIESEFNRRRVEDLVKRLGTDATVKELDRRSKIWCNAGVRECCAAGAHGLPVCAKDPAAE